MKRMLILLCVLWSVVASAQAPPGYTNISSRYDWLAGKFRALHIPAYGTTPSLQTGQWIGSGAIGIDSVLHRQFFYSGGSWRRLLNAADSTLYATVTALNNAANTDSLFGVQDNSSSANRSFNMHNTHSFQFDSVNAFTIVRSAVNRFSVNSISTQITSPDGLNYTTASNVFAGFTAGSATVYTHPDSITFNQPSGNYSIYALPQRTDTTANKVMTWDASTKKMGWGNWYGSGGGGSGWSLTGNSGTTAGTNFLGTTDNVDLVLKTNNSQAARFYVSGAVNMGNQTSGNLNIGKNSGLILDHTFSFANTSVGQGTFQFSDSINESNAFGVAALANARGSAAGNNAMGNAALELTTTGPGNNVMGTDGFKNNTTGGYNVGMGNGVARYSTTSSYKTIMGTAANSYGGNNTAVVGAFGMSTAKGDGVYSLGYAADVLDSNLTNAGAIGTNTKVRYSNTLILGDSVQNTYVGIMQRQADSALSVGQGIWGKRGVRFSGLSTSPGTKAVRIDANGVLSIADTTVGGGSGTPGGSNTQVQYNNAGAFGGISGATSDGTTLTITAGRAITNFSPSSNDGAALGTTLLQWSDLFLAEGAVINFDNGDMTITQVGNTLTVAGGVLSNPGAGGSSEIFGAGANAAGLNGSSFGGFAAAGGTNATAIGYLSSASADNTTAVGKSSNASAAAANAFGNGATASGSSATSVGAFSIASGTNAVALGISSSATGVNAFALGGNTSAGHDNSIALGRSTVTTATAQFVTGNENVPLNDFYFGEGVTSTTPSAITFNATGGSGTNIAGATFNIAAGKGTGNSTTNGEINFQTSDAGASGTTLQTLTTKMTLSKTGDLIIDPGKIGIAITPTAYLHFKSGQTSANNAPIKFASGSILTTIENGTKEYGNGNAHYETNGASNRYALGGVIADFYSTVDNSGTGETDLYTYTTKASTLAVDGAKIKAQFSGTFNDATATAQLQVYFAGTVILNTGALTVSSITPAWDINVTIIRTSTTTARAIVTAKAPGTSTASFSVQTDLTGEDWTATNILKITGTAGGGGGGSSDISAKLGTIFWYGAAAN